MSVMSEQLANDPVEDSRYHNKYMKSKYDNTRKQFRKVVNTVRLDQNETLTQMKQEEAKKAQQKPGHKDPYAEMKDQLKKLEGI